MNIDIDIFCGSTLVIMELILKFHILSLFSNAMYHHFSGKGTAFSISLVTSGGGRVTEHWSAVTLILMECGGSGLAADSHNALFCSSSIPILIIIDCWSCNLVICYYLTPAQSYPSEQNFTNQRDELNQYSLLCITHTHHPLLLHLQTHISEFVVPNFQPSISRN